MAAIIKYYWSLFRFATERAWGFSQLAAAILTFIGGYVGYKHPEWGPTMNNLLWMLPLGLFVLLFVIRLILAPYEKYKEQQKKYQAEVANLQKELQNKLTQKERNIKQEIRAFLESIKPAILQKLDNMGQRKFHVWLSSSDEIKLINLSEHPEFFEYLSFKRNNDISDADNKGNLENNPNDFGYANPPLNYYFTAKDALKR